jgi:uncharacterized membrane protein
MKPHNLLLIRAAQVGVVLGALIAGRDWMGIVALALALAVAVLAAALTATRVRLREIKAHDDRQYLWLQNADLGTDFQAGEGDEGRRR